MNALAYRTYSDEELIDQAERTDDPLVQELANRLEKANDQIRFGDICGDTNE